MREPRNRDESRAKAPKPSCDSSESTATATASKLSDVAHRELITTEKASLNLNRHTHAVGEQLFRGLPTIDEDKVDALLENFSSVAPVHGGIDATADALLEEAQKQFDEKNNL